MCGIVGVWRENGSIAPADLSDVVAMAQALAHRGPDDSGEWHDDLAAFGHRRLAIVDPSALGREPMVTSCGQGVLVYNGEVYNFRTLRRDLQAEGAIFRSESDTEVVLEALHRWGPARAVPLFDGMFAFAYYDRRARALWLARDRLGIKPLSFARLYDRFLFASEDKALLACQDVAGDVDARELTLRLADQHRDSSYSLFSRIERLPPGALWRLAQGRTEKNCFWHVLDALNPSRISGGAPRSPVEALERLLADSVEMHCIADAALATACSGGVDSGMVTALAARVRPEARAYVVDPALGVSEAAKAERAAGRAGVDLRRVHIDRAAFLELWPRAVWHMETSGWHGSHTGLLAMAERCRGDGVKVLLTGEGADELFGGYAWQRRSMRRWRRAHWLPSLFRSTRKRDALLANLRLAPFHSSSGGTTRQDRLVAMRALSPELNFLDTRLFDRLEGAGSLEDRAFIGACLADLYGHLQDLLHRHDRLGMAASIEARVPFLENALIDFAIHLPRPFKYRERQGKWLLKKVAEKYLPRENIYAPKVGFDMDMGFSKGSEGILRGGMLAQAMKWSAPATEDLVDLAARDENSRLRMVGLELFLRLYVGGETPGRLTEMLERTTA